MDGGFKVHKKVQKIGNDHAARVMRAASLILHPLLPTSLLSELLQCLVISWLVRLQGIFSFTTVTTIGTFAPNHVDVKPCITMQQHLARPSAYHHHREYDGFCCSNPFISLSAQPVLGGKSYSMRLSDACRSVHKFPSNRIQNLPFDCNL